MNASAARPKDDRSYTITELAQEFDITPRAIRFYEDVGLLAPERAGRNRVYSQRDRTRLKLTLRGKRLGFSLTEIRQLVTMYESPADTGPQLEAFREALAKHRQQLEQQLEDLQITLTEIAQHEGRCERLLCEQRAAASPPAAQRRRRATAVTR
ncbi:MerR family DNA-binding transcriptional regulator [Aquincola sp. S2]|uniref:MerR family DNA-binding transcriptional regulator n=1 Tax=Pseudaquabacterium terrae TaxID=2732868 RepID=A0ABX2EAG8_9BURK|nr:MerR family DNA-binding transcriptional regulator [Aquabacterium terrae]NRF66084.1 MerR family DNA-binding transcriptional regulator [Aquabacterium terrae]